MMPPVLEKKGGAEEPSEMRTWFPVSMDVWQSNQFGVSVRINNRRPCSPCQHSSSMPCWGIPLSTL